MVDIGWLVENGPCKKFTAGMNIPCPGGPEPSKKAMYILLAGRVDVIKKNAAGGTQMVASLGSGDVFGGREYFTGADDCTYVAVVDSAVYIISEESFNDLSWSRPEILFEILRAAYMPPKKMTAASREAHKTKAQSAAKTPPPEAATPETATSITATPETAEPQTAATPKTAATPTAVIKKESGSSLFPEGHKSYPGITKPEYAKLVFPKDYNCPYCKASFKDFRVFRSKLFESAPMRYDLRKFYTDFQSEWYDVLTCRNCSFSTVHNYFTEPKPIQKAKIEKELAEISPQVKMDFSAERDIDFVFTSHYLAVLCSAAYPSVGKQIRAKLWGNLSWLYEDVNDDEMAKFAAANAAEAYEQVYTESRLTPIQEQVTCLSIAGMQHRAGLDKNLKKFIFTAKTMSAGDKTYSKLAEDFMYELKIAD